MALAKAALTGKPQPVPGLYALELLARRWNVRPDEIERDLGDPLLQAWIERSLTFMELEAQSSKVNRG